MQRRIGPDGAGPLLQRDERARFYRVDDVLVAGLTKRAAKEYASEGIRVNAVLPGTIETPMPADMVADGAIDPDEAQALIPLGRVGRTDEIAAAVLWPASPGASFVTGATLLAAGAILAWLREHR